MKTLSEHYNYPRKTDFGGPFLPSDLTLVTFPLPTKNLLLRLAKCVEAAEAVYIIMMKGKLIILVKKTPKYQRSYISDR